MVFVILRRLLIPTSGCTIAVVYAKKKETCDPARTLVKASELPLYTEDKPCAQCTPKVEEETSALVQSIKQTRMELWNLMRQARLYTGNATGYFSVVKDQTDIALQFLREESNLIPRVGAIGVAGMTGFILGLRKGLITRLFYTTVLATGMAALCYPREAQEYSVEGMQIAKHYFLISYHFINGVSRDLTGYQLPPLPSGHLVISEGPHHHDSSEAVPSSAQLLPPTLNATHIPMPHEEHENKKQHREQSKSEN